MLISTKISVYLFIVCKPTNWIFEQLLEMVQSALKSVTSATKYHLTKGLLQRLFLENLYRPGCTLIGYATSEITLDSF